LREQVEKLNSHLGGLETEGLAEEAREGVPQRRNTLGRMPHSPLSTLVTGEEDSISHLGGLETEGHAEEVREGVPRRRNA
jgi:hypothetical protein